MPYRLRRLALRALTAIPLLVVGFAAAASAQSVIPPQINTYLCQNFQAIKNLAPLVALLVFAAALIFGLIRRHSNLVVDLIVGGLIALVIINLPTILASVGLSAGCS
jgi:hypothetical protein